MKLWLIAALLLLSISMVYNFSEKIDYGLGAVTGRKVEYYEVSKQPEQIIDSIKRQNEMQYHRRSDLESAPRLTHWRIEQDKWNRMGVVQFTSQKMRNLDEKIERVFEPFYKQMDKLQ